MLTRPPSLARFFTLAFGITYALQVPALAAQQGWIETPLTLLMPLAMLGIFGPAVAAVVVTHAERGKTGVRALFCSLRPKDMRIMDLVVAMLLPAALLAAVLFLLRLAGRQGPIVYLPEASRLLVGLVIAFAEEIGWRGVAQPRMEKRFGRIGGAGLVGLLWTLWHIPMFIGQGVDLSWLLVMALFFVGGSLVCSWLQQRSPSLLLPVLLHFGANLNNSHLALPDDGLPLVVHAIVYATLGLGLSGYRPWAPLPDDLAAVRVRRS